MMVKSHRAFIAVGNVKVKMHPVFVTKNVEKENEIIMLLGAIPHFSYVISVSIYS